MNRFAALLDRLSYEPRRNAKIRLMADYFGHTPDPERGWALAFLTGSLSFRHAKPGLIRGLIEARADPTLFYLSWDYVGDLSETVALMWPKAGTILPREGTADSDAIAAGPGGAAHLPPMIGHNNPPPQVPALSEVVEGLASTNKIDLPRLVAGWLDALDETGRWALLKLITSEPRVGVSARLAKTAVAALGDVTADEIEQVWHGLEPPYADLFAWVEGRGPQPESRDPAPFRPPMLSHPLDEEDFAKLDAAAFTGEWKWDGIRVQAVCGRHPDGRLVRRLYSRTGEEISRAFPDLVESFAFEGAVDGELLILREGRVQSFNVLQQRLNRKAVSPKLAGRFPGPYPRLRPPGRGRGGSARPALRRAPPAARSVHRPHRQRALRRLAAGAVRDLGRSRRRPRRAGLRRRRRRRRRHRGLHDQARRQPLRAGPAEGAVVQMEA